MSVQAVKWAFYDAPVLLTEKGKPDSVARQVLGVLGEHANDRGGNAHPSVLRIRYATGLDERTIERALLRLQRSGLIEMAGRTREGTRIWKLHLREARPESEWPEMVARADAERAAESARRKARRHRSSCAESEVPEDECPGRRVPDVRDAECRMSGTERPPNHQVEPPIGTTTGGAPPPDPRRPPSASLRGTDQQNSLADPLTPAQDQQSESLPHAGARAGAPPVPEELANVIPLDTRRPA